MKELYHDAEEIVEPVARVGDASFIYLFNMAVRKCRKPYLNIKFYGNLFETLKDIPIIVAFNKQDLPEKFNSRVFLREIKFHEIEKVETRYTIAINGEGVLDCFEDILRLILGKYYKHKLVSAVNWFN